MELARLAALGLDWPDARAQCVLAYFKLAAAFQLDYDTEFCAVRAPEHIWALVQVGMRARAQNKKLKTISSAFSMQKFFIEGSKRAACRTR